MLEFDTQKGSQFTQVYIIELNEHEDESSSIAIARIFS